MLLQEILLILLLSVNYERVKLIASNLNPNLAVAPPQITKERANLSQLPWFL